MRKLLESLDTIVDGNPVKTGSKIEKPKSDGKFLGSPYHRRDKPKSKSPEDLSAQFEDYVKNKAVPDSKKEYRVVKKGDALAVVLDEKGVEVTSGTKSDCESYISKKKAELNDAKLAEGSSSKEKQKRPYKTMAQHVEAGKAYRAMVAADKKAKEAEQIGKKKTTESAGSWIVYRSATDFKKFPTYKSACSFQSKWSERGYKVASAEWFYDKMAHNDQTSNAGDLDEGRYTINAKTGAKLHPRTGEEIPGSIRPPKVATPRAPASARRDSNGFTKEDYSKVWHKIEDVVSNIFPDGDPIDWLAPWLKKSGIEDYHIGEVLDKASRMNGFKDIYAYYDSFKTSDYGYNESVEQVDEAHKLNDEVVISYPSLRGVKGRIGEIRHGAYKGAPKTYTVDYQHPKHPEGHISSIQLSSDQFKAHKPGKLGEEVKHLDAKWNHPTKKNYTYDPEISDKHVAGFSDDRGEQTYLKRAALPNNHPAKKLDEEVESLDEAFKMPERATWEKVNAHSNRTIKAEKLAKTDPTPENKQSAKDHRAHLRKLEALRNKQLKNGTLKTGYSVMHGGNISESSLTLSEKLARLHEAMEKVSAQLKETRKLMFRSAKTVDEDTPPPAGVQTAMPQQPKPVVQTANPVKPAQQAPAPGQQVSTTQQAPAPAGTPAAAPQPGQPTPLAAGQAGGAPVAPPAQGNNNATTPGDMVKGLVQTLAQNPAAAKQLGTKLSTIR